MDHGAARRAGIAVAAAVSAAIALTGCTHAQQLPDDYGHAWLDRMRDAISDTTGGQGGGGGQLTKSGDHAEAGVFMDSVEAGTYDVLAVCRSTATVHVRVQARNGDDAGPTLAQDDVVCGATSRMRITVPRGSGIGIEVRTSDTSERALWDAMIVRPGWRSESTTP